MGSGPWYRDGLRFECTQCGNCCSGEPGYVWMNNDEIRRLAVFLGMTVEEFLGRHVRRVAGRASLRELPNGDCTLLKRNGELAICTAYDHRPTQCRTFPFWDGILRSRRSWEKAAEKCPGINRGLLHGFVGIETLRVQRS